METKKYIIWTIKFISIILLICFYQKLSPHFSQTVTYPNHVEKTLYIDRNFTDDELYIIVSAAISWSESTHYIVKYNIVTMPNYQKIDVSNGIIISKVSPDNPTILIQSGFNGDNNSNILGYYNGREEIPFIIIVADNMQNAVMYRTTILHELGHSLGLKHNIGIDGIGTLMYPAQELGADNITETDLENFCKLYHCDASKL